MFYQAINKETLEFVTLSHLEVNDMDCDDQGRVIIYGTTGEVYFALLTKDNIN